MYQLLADAVLVIHSSVVAFVVGGLVMIVVGNRSSWDWVNGFGFRVAHLLSIAMVVAEAWLGITCPLTTIESELRRRAGGSPYTRSFVEHWIQPLLFYDAPPWAFALAYTLFGSLVVAAWWYFPPGRAPSRRRCR